MLSAPNQSLVGCIMNTRSRLLARDRRFFADDRDRRRAHISHQAAWNARHFARIHPPEDLNDPSLMFSQPH
jgi:hypothetical protein